MGGEKAEAEVEEEEEAEEEEEGEELRSRRKADHDRRVSLRSIIHKPEVEQQELPASEAGPLTSRRGEHATV